MICFGRSRSRSSTTALCQRLRNGVGGGRVQRHVHLESFRSRDLGEALQPAIGEPAPDQDGRTGPVRFIGVIPNTSEAVAKMAKQLAKHRKARPLHNPMQCNRSKRAAMQDSSALQYLAIDTIHESTTNPRRTFEEAKLYGLPRRSPKSASPQVTPTCLLDPRRRHRPQPTISAGARTGRRRNRTCYPPSTLLVLLLPLLGLFVCLGFGWWRHSWGGILGQTRGGAGVMNRTVVVGAYGDGGSGTFAVDDGGFAAAHGGAGSASGFWVTFRFRGRVRAGRLPASALSGCGSRSRSGLTRGWAATSRSMHEGQAALLAGQSHEAVHQAGYTESRHHQEHRLAHLPPFLRHAAEGEWGRRENRTGSLEAREQQDHARRVHAGRELGQTSHRARL